MPTPRYQPPRYIRIVLLCTNHFSTRVVTRRWSGTHARPGLPVATGTRQASCVKKKGTMRVLKALWNILTTAVVAIVVIFAVLLVGARLAGFQVFSVLSGSMEPTYHTGSLIYVQDVDYTQLQPGDVITFMLDEDTVATHRIVQVVPDTEDPTVLRYQTKGDANQAVDGSLVHYKNVIGTPVFTIPYLGYAANYVQNPPGTYIAISVGALLLVLMLLPDLLSNEEEAPKQSKPKKQKQPKRSNKKSQPITPANTEPTVAMYGPEYIDDEPAARPAGKRFASQPADPSYGPDLDAAPARHFKK